ncbi:hypothetical protein [Timonella sp. A28]|uniref:hypothetical protein n=1 Tax=Timonella sp. A28 TaxID=3442640 RepID=UPI003EB74BCB
MLTSTQATTARPLNYSLRDAVNPTTVDSFMNLLIATLRHYETTGRLHPDGLTADQVANFSFTPARGQGYARVTVEKIRNEAILALRTYEGSLAGGSVLHSPLTRINRVKQLAPHVSLDQARDTTAVSSPAAARTTTYTASHAVVPTPPLRSHVPAATTEAAAPVNNEFASPHTTSSIEFPLDVLTVAEKIHAANKTRERLDRIAPGQVTAPDLIRVSTPQGTFVVTGVQVFQDGQIVLRTRR